MCNRSGCFIRALRKGVDWKPKLRCTGHADLPTVVVSLMQRSIDRNALAMCRPLVLNFAIAFKEKVGKDYFKDIMHWGHASIRKSHWGKWACTCRRAGSIWTRNIDPCTGCRRMRAIWCTLRSSTTVNGMRSLALRQWLRRRRATWWSSYWHFGSITPFYQGAFAQRPRDDIIRAYSELSERAAQAEAKHGVGAVIPCVVRSLRRGRGRARSGRRRHARAGRRRPVPGCDEADADAQSRGCGEVCSDNYCGTGQRGHARAGHNGRRGPFPAMAVAQPEAAEAAKEPQRMRSKHSGEVSWPRRSMRMQRAAL